MNEGRRTILDRALGVFGDVRSIDALAAGSVWLGTHVFIPSIRGFAVANVLLVTVRLVLAWLLWQEYRRKQAHAS